MTARPMLKRLGSFVGLVRATPHVLAYIVAIRLLGRDRAFRSASERIARLPGLVGVSARQWFYRCTLDAVGADVHFGFMTVFSKPDIRIGERVYLGRFCTIGLADLADGVRLADGVQLLSGGRQHLAADVEAPVAYTRITIGLGAWIGAQAVVMADVGPGAIVGAAAVVTRPTPEGAVVGGSPARPLPRATRAAA